MVSIAPQAALRHPVGMMKASTWFVLLRLSTAMICVTSCGAITPSQKTELISAAQSLTDAAFTAGGPALTAATLALPPEVQVLIQAGYGALRKAVEVAEASGIEHAGAQAAIQSVAATADALHGAVHITDSAPAG